MIAVSLLLGSACYMGHGYFGNKPQLTKTSHATTIMISKERDVDEANFVDEDQVFQDDDFEEEEILPVDEINMSTGGAYCSNPIQVGELMNQRYHSVLDIDGSDGKGMVKVNKYMDGQKDQVLILCGDGTLRNQRENYCISALSNGKLKSENCNLLTGPKKNQLWSIYKRGSFKQPDYAGMKIKGLMLKNQGSGKCMVSKKTDSSSKWAQLENCNDKSGRNWWYFKNRGGVVKTGRLVNEKSKYCLDVEGTDGTGRIRTSRCDQNAQDQLWTQWGNGEITNVKSGKWIDLKGTDGKGKVQTNKAHSMNDHLWFQHDNLRNGQYNSFVNKKLGTHCINMDKNGKGNANANTCDGTSKQRFKWESENFITPEISWKRVGICNHSGGLTLKVTNSVKYAESQESSWAASVSSTIEAGTTFGGVSVTAEVSHSLAESFSNEVGSEHSTTLTCDTYDNGEKFTKGCMWQLNMQTQNSQTADKVNWNAGIVRCTDKDIAPTCPPFTRCKNKECSSCEAYV